MHRFKLLSRVHPVLQQTRHYIAELDRSAPKRRWPKYVLTVGAVLTVTVWSLITLFRNSVKKVLTLKQYITEEDRAECRTAAQSWIVAHKGVFTRQEIHSEIVKSAAPIFKRLSIRELSVDESLRAEREKIAADQVREVYKSLTSMDHIRIKGLYHQLALFLFYTDEELDIIMRSKSLLSRTFPAQPYLPSAEEIEEEKWRPEGSAEGGDGGGGEEQGRGT